MATIRAIHTDLPSHQVSSEKLDQIAHQWLANDPEALEKFLRLTRKAGVKNRHYTLAPEEVLTLGGLQERASIFLEYGRPLLSNTVESLFKKADLPKSSLGHVLFSSCSVPVIPSLDALVIEDVGLPRSVRRIPIYQHGCAGGVISLGLGARLASLGQPILLTSLELCSLVFQAANHAGSQLVGAALFGDGAAAVVLEPEGDGLRILDSQSYLIPASYALMGYDLFDDGFHLRLDKSLPQVLVREAPALVQAFLEKHQIAQQDIAAWLFHPGGVRILDFFEEAFSLEASQCSWARSVLQDCGNLSSATVLFVLERYLRESRLEKGEYALMLGVGPGLTLELVLFGAPH